MTYKDLLLRLKQWENHNPELLDQPALVSLEPGDEPTEIDDIEFKKCDGILDPEGVHQQNYLLLTP